MAKISPQLAEWLQENKLDRREVRFTNNNSLSGEQWIRLADFVKEHADTLRAAYSSVQDEDLAIERVAAIISMNEIRPISPTLVRNSVSVMAILKGSVCSPAGIKRNR